ncbi:MAG: rRNA maturation RNase YbeY [Bacteroidota bacterium]
MSSSTVHFYTVDVSLNLKSRRLLKTWIKDLVNKENADLIAINFIFCSDSYLLSMNQEWLQHDTLTDVITFDLSDKSTKNRLINGEVYISLERLKANAAEYKVSVREETCRVMAHGVLHLLGYSDKTSSQKKLMRQKENLYLSLLRNS